MNLSLKIKLLLLILLFISGFFLSLFFGGTEGISFDSGSWDFIFYSIRLPKSLTAIGAGMALAISGLILQVIFQNPLAGPYVLGISSGASLFVALTILASSGVHWFYESLIGKGAIVFSAVIGSSVATLLILFISRKVKSNLVLLLIGLMISQICGAIESALQYFADPGSLKTMVVWGLGSLSNTTSGELKIFLPLVFLFLIFTLLKTKLIQALLLGDHYALNLGVDIQKNRTVLVLLSSALTGLATAFCGPLAFVGMATPILMRAIFPTANQFFQMIVSLISGATVLLISDVICNNLMPGVVLPINVITTFIGAPIVIYLVAKNKSW